jgi:hypothetical protein
MSLDAGAQVTTTGSVWEANLLKLLDQAGVKFYSERDGTVRWALDADDVCTVVELAFYLFEEWRPQSPLEAWNRTARLLGIPALPDPDDA